MFVSFRPDVEIGFEDLIDGRLGEWEIVVEQGTDRNGNPIATLIRDHAKVLVRFRGGKLDRLLPDGSFDSGRIIAAVGATYGAAMTGDTEKFGDYFHIEEHIH